MEEYEIEIKKYHEAILDYPDNENLKSKLNYRLGKWVDFLNIVIYRAENEQTGYTDKELGYKVKPMPLKSESSFNQVGDYHIYISDYDVLSGLVIERKGVSRKKNIGMVSCDLYNTLFHKENRIRFKKEFARFQADLRLDTFKVIVECSYGEYLSFSPKFSGNKLSPIDHNGASRQSRIGTISSLELDGCHVIFAGTREMAIEMYRSMIRQWVIKHYQFILRLDSKR